MGFPKLSIICKTKLELLEPCGDPTSMTSQHCLYCKKQVKNPMVHTHGIIVKSTKEQFLNYIKSQFMQTYHDNGKVIYCITSGRTMSFYCPWCKRDHTHGKEDGMRASHCHSRDSPFYGICYEIKEKLR